MSIVLHAQLMKRAHFLELLLTAILAHGAGQAQSGYARRTLQVFPSAATQTEPVIAIHPRNPSMLFVSAVTINTETGFKSEGVYVSTDGGLHWGGSDTCKGSLIVNHGGDPGVAIDTNGRLIITHIGDIFPGTYSHYSTDLGSTWSSAYTLSSQQAGDKGTMTIDDAATSPYEGRLYASWVDYVSPYPVMFSSSANSAQSWATPVAVNPSPPSPCAGGSVATGPDGIVYVCWAGVATTTPFAEQLVGFASSTDGGATWGAKQNIYAMSGINGTLSSKGNIRVNGLPQLAVDRSGGTRKGSLYIVTTEKGLAPAGSDPDVILHRSTDGGATWSAGIRVNQDSLNVGHDQYFPAMVVDSSGRINIIYYDDRNTSSDSAEIMLSQSTDGGDTWTEHVVSNHRFKPKPIVAGPSNYQGDHIALASSGNLLYALWMDDYSGIYQVWMSIIDTTITDIRRFSRPSPAFIHLSQNYPNPFNPRTDIGFRIVNFGLVTLKVYDILGREVATIVNEFKQPGEYTERWDASNVPSGVYYYRLSAGTATLVGKMLLLK